MLKIQFCHNKNAFSNIGTSNSIVEVRTVFLILDDFNTRK